MDSYYEPADLRRFSEIGEHAPELGEKFFAWYGAVFQDGALTAREKSLIALAWHTRFSVLIASRLTPGTPSQRAATWSS
jgi:hypothetical protein